MGSVMMRAQGMPTMMSGRMIMAVVFRAVAMRMTVGMTVGVLRGISVGGARGMGRVSGVVLCCEILIRGATLRSAIDAEMRMPVGMGMGAAHPISAAFGSKRRSDRLHRGPKTPQHIGQNLIILNEQPVFFDLTRGMPVADMPSKSRQVAVHRKQSFGFGQHRDHPPILKPKSIARLKAFGFRQIHQEHRAARRAKPFAPQKPCLVAERDMICARMSNRRRIRRGAVDICGAKYGHMSALKPQSGGARAALMSRGPIAAFGT